MWDKLSPGRVNTWKLGAYNPTTREMGVREESASGASLHQMLTMPGGWNTCGV